MPWTKLKNIILVILALTNLSLLFLVAGPALQGRQRIDQAWEEAIRFLRNRGVQVEEGIVPRSMDLPPLKLERDLEREERSAAALLGGGVTAEARGGEVYRYFNDKGSVQFHSDGTISAQLESAAFPLGEDRRAGCLALMERMELEGTILEEEGDELVFRQTWRGSPLFTQQMTLVCRDGGLAEIAAGRQLVGRPQEDPERTTLSAATALIDFLNGAGAMGDVCNRIDAIQPGYVTTASLSGSTLLTPVWRITTDTGAYQLDAVTGAVTRVS